MKLGLWTFQSTSLENSTHILRRLTRVYNLTNTYVCMYVCINLDTWSISVRMCHFPLQLTILMQYCNPSLSLFVCVSVVLANLSPSWWQTRGCQRHHLENCWMRDPLSSPLSPPPSPLTTPTSRPTRVSGSAPTSTTTSSRYVSKLHLSLSLSLAHDPCS